MREGGAGRRAGGRGLTTRGRCLLAGGVAAVICAVVLDERDLLRVGLLACFLPIIAVAVSALRRPQVSGEHQVTPERLRPGSHGTVVLSVRNIGQTRTPAIDISETPTAGLTRGMRYLIAPIRPGHGTRVSYPIMATHRGLFAIGPPQVRIHDPFDLWEEQRTLAVRTEVLVVPVVVALTGMPSSSGARSAASGRTSVGTTGGDPDVGVRPYRSGDDIRTIHWRASARHEELVVRLEEPVSHGGATVLIDHRASAHRGHGAASSLETAVTMAASVALHLLTADHRVRLISHRSTVIAEGHDIADDVLAGLAVLNPDPSPALREPALGRTGLLVAVVGEMSVADATALAVSKRRSVNGVALVIQTDQWTAPPGRPDVETPASANLLRAAGWRVVIIRPEDDLATCWRRACSSDDYAMPTASTR